MTRQVYVPEVGESLTRSFIEMSDPPPSRWRTVCRILAITGAVALIALVVVMPQLVG